VNDGASEAYAHRAQALSELGRDKQALKDATSAVELAPEWAGAYHIRGSIHAALGDSEAAAADEAKAMVLNLHVSTVEFPGPSEPSPSEPDAGGQPFDPDDTVPEMDEGDGSPGYEELRVRAAGDTSAATYYARGFAKVRNKALEEGIEDYTRAIQADANFAAAYNNRGVAYRSLGRTEDAIRDYDRAIALDPNYAMAYINRGGAYGVLNDTGRALADMTKGIELEPEMVEGYADRGAVYGKLKRFDEAIADLQRALQIDPNYAGGYYNLGVLLSNRGDLDEGLRAIERAAALGMPSAVEGAKWLRQEIEKRKSKRE
jgi:tetratricopeptide (TPR) repeat protein